MERNYQRYLEDDGHIDVELLANAAMYEFCCTQQLADDLAGLVQAAVDEPPAQAEV